MYIPKDSMDVSALPKSPIRLGIMGPAGIGKTWSALTFPNPVVLDLDNKLGGYREAYPNVKFPVLPFWSRDFVENTLKVSNMGLGKPTDPKFPANARDAVDKWLTIEGPKLSPEQTLILDSFTSLNDAFTNQTSLPHEKEYTKTGQEDGFAFWKKLLAYNTKICSLLKNLPCNVVAIFHELPERSEDGIVIGIKPLLQGQSADKIPGYFTDFYQQKYLVNDPQKPITYFKFENGERGAYVWQTCKDRRFQIACKSLSKLPDFVRATYSSLIA